MIYFITSNAGKFREIQTLIPDAEQLDLDLDEIQNLDPQVVIKHKLEQAAKQHDGQFMIDDTSLAIDSLGRLPGTLIKWFVEAMGAHGISELTAKYPDQSAIARTVIGYRDSNGGNHYFTGELRGKIVPPRGEEGFGWDAIFQPDGHDKTFAELGPELKLTISPRRLAGDQLKTFLNQRSR